MKNMSWQESQGTYPSKIPLFDGTNYALWKVELEAYLMSSRVDVYSSILVDYDLPNVPSTNVDRKSLYENNAKTKTFILFVLSEFEIIKIMY